MISGNDFRMPDAQQEEASTVSAAEGRAWARFFHSGKVEDYIRYAQLKRRDETGCCAAGVLNAGKDPGADH